MRFFIHSVVLLIATITSPIRADDPPQWGALYTDAHFFGSINANRANAQLISETCTAGCYNYQRWHTISAGKSPSGHSITKLKSCLNNQCISSNGQSHGGTAYQKPCSTHYENWEVFPVSQRGGTFYVFQSWGAWVHQGKHLCLQANGNPAYVRMEECDTNNRQQRWG